jgi:hypothetical protein
MQEAVTKLAGVFKTSGATVTCQRSNATDFTWQAQPCEPKFETSNEPGGALLEWDGVDFVGPAADYVFGGTPGLPARGDRLVLGDRVYEVMSPAGLKPYLFEPYGVLLRVHTRQVQA